MSGGHGSGNRALPVLAGAFFTQFAAGFGFLSFNLLAPSLAAETGLNERDFGLAITFIFLGTAFAGTGTGILVRRFGGVGTVVLTLFAMAAATSIVLFGTWATTMLAAFLFGLVYGPQGAVGMTVVTERTPPSRRGLFLALRHSSQPLAGVIAGRVLPPLMLVLGWQSGVFTTVSLLVAGALFTLAMPSLFRLETRPAPAAQRGGGGIGRILAGAAGLFVIPKGMRLLWITGLVFAFNQIAMMVFSYLYLLEVVKLTPVAAGIFSSNLQIAGLLGRPLLGWFCDKTGRSQLVLACLASVGVAAIVALFQLASADLPAWALFLIALGCGIAGQTWNAVFTTAMSFKIPPEKLAEMNGRAFGFLSLGWMMGGPFFWLLIELSGGYVVPFSIILVANVISGIALFAAARHEGHGQPTDDR